MSIPPDVLAKAQALATGEDQIPEVGTMSEELRNRLFSPQGPDLRIARPSDPVPPEGLVHGAMTLSPGRYLLTLLVDADTDPQTAVRLKLSDSRLITKVELLSCVQIGD